MTDRITFNALLDEVRKDGRACGNFMEAFKRLIKKHDISAGVTSEVLHCAFYLKLKGYPRKSAIPYSQDNLAEFVRVLRHYDVSFDDAIVLGFRQFRIEDYSPRAKRLFREVGAILGVRKGWKVA